MTTSSDSLSPGIWQLVARRAVGLWLDLTAPATLITAPDRRRQARLLSALLLVMIPFCLLFAFASPRLPRSLSEMLVMTALSLALTYVLNRTQYYRAAAVLFLGIQFLLPVLGLAFAGTSAPLFVTRDLVYLILSVLLASLFFPVRGIALVMAGNVGLILLLSLFNPSVGYNTGIHTLLFVGIVSVLVLISTDHRNRLERMRLSQLTDTNCELEKLRASSDQRVAELKQAEEALRESQSFYASLVEVLPQSLCRKDLQGRFTFGNQKYCAALNLSAAELCGKTDYDIHPPDLAAKYIEDDRHVIETGELFETVEEHQVLDGERTYVHVVKSPIRDGAGQINGIQIIFWDVTASKRTEEELRQAHEELEQRVQARTSELAQANEALQVEVTERRRAEEALAAERNLLRTLMDHVPDSVFFKDTASRFIRVNQYMARRLGFDAPEELLGKTDFDAFSEEHARQAFEDEQEILRTGQPLVNKEEKETFPDGTLKWVTTTKLPLRNAEGEIVGTCGLSRDITERKQAEAALAEERNLLRTLIDNLPDYIYIKDLAGRFIACNAAHQQLLGACTPEGVLGKTDYDFFPKELADQYRADEQRVMQEGQAQLGQEELNINRTTNQLTWNLATKVPFRDSGGQIVGCISISHDITEQKLISEALSKERNLLRSLIDLAPDYVYIKDRGSRYVVNNAAHIRQLRAKNQEELVGKWDFDFFPYELAKQYYEDEQHVMSSGQPLIDREEMTLDPDRNPSWVWSSKVPIRDHLGRVTGFVGITRDITERKRMEEALRESEFLYHSLVEVLPQSLLRKDLEGRFTFVNRRYCEDMGRTAAQIIGQTDFDVHPREVAEKYRQDDRRVIETGETIDIIEEHVPLGGEKSYVHVIKTPVRDAQGKITGVQIIFSDVTHIKRTEEALRQSEERFRMLFENSPDAILLIDPRVPQAPWPIVDCNAAACTMNGYTREELIGQPIDLLNLTESDGTKRAAYLERLRQQNVHRLEAIHRRKDGTTLYLQTSTSLINLAGRELILGIDRDMTERKQAQEALAKERNLLRTLIDNLPDYIYVKDTAGRFLVSNMANARALGESSPEGVIGKMDYDFFSRELADQYRADEKAVLSGQALINREEPTINHLTGQRAWNWTTKVPLRDRQGKIIGLVGMNRDITARKQIEEALQLQSTRLQIALEVAKAVTSHLEIAHVLPRVAKLIRQQFGYYWTGIFLMDETGQWAEVHAASGETGQNRVELGFRFEVSGPSMIGSAIRTGRPRISQDVRADQLYLAHPNLAQARSAAVFPLFIGDTPIGALDVESAELDAFAPETCAVLQTMADQIAVAVQNARLHAAVTEHARDLERAYRALQENQEQLLVAERMASLGRLTAGIAHEMNTPLATVRAALAQLKELAAEYEQSIGEAELTPQDHQEIAREMHESIRLADAAAARAASFVRGIKTQTRDLLPHERQHFNAVPVIQETLLLVGHALRHSNCTVTFEPAAEVISLHGLPGRLAQVVTNLVTNAIDASLPKGGGPITLSLARYDRHTELQIMDRGCGISPEVISKIFDPMFTTKPFGQGTGLGLTIVRDIITGDFGGTIEVESQVEVGTGFTIRFPNSVEAQ